jgi:hypothetical protein
VQTKETCGLPELNRRSPMNAFRTIVALSTAATALALVTGAGSTPPPTSAQGAGSNFHIVAPGPVAFAFEPFPCGGFRITGLAAASGTHVGSKGTMRADECSRPDGPINHVDGQAVVTATGGDEIAIHYYGDAPAADASGAIHEDLTFVITGGTGHFEDATGGGRLTTNGVINFFGPTLVTAHLDGTIKLHGGA